MNITDHLPTPEVSRLVVKESMCNKGTVQPDTFGAKRSPCYGPLGPLVTGRPRGAGPITAPRVEFTHAMADRLGARFGADEADGFRCPLPGHEGRAKLITNDRGELALGCCTQRWRSLGEVRAAEGYKSDAALRSNIELAAWTRLLAWELGGFEPVPVALPSPQGVRLHVMRAAEGFALLCGLRWKDYERRPVAYSIRFAVAWSDLTFREANVALSILKEQEVIREGGRVKRCRLWEPGPPQGDGEVLTVPTLTRWKGWSK